MLSQIEQNFREAFDDILDINGGCHEFAFSDGCTPEGRIRAHITVLWVREVTSYLHMHSHMYNSAMFHGDRILMMRAKDVPDRARLFANDYLDADDVTYKIVSSRLKDGLWHLELSAVGTT